MNQQVTRTLLPNFLFDLYYLSLDLSSGCCKNNMLYPFEHEIQEKSSLKTED